MKTSSSVRTRTKFAFGIGAAGEATQYVAFNTFSLRVARTAAIYLR